MTMSATDKTTIVKIVEECKSPEDYKFVDLSAMTYELMCYPSTTLKVQDYSKNSAPTSGYTVFESTPSTNSKGDKCHPDRHKLVMFLPLVVRSLLMNSYKNSTYIFVYNEENKKEIGMHAANVLLALASAIGVVKHMILGSKEILPLPIDRIKKVVALFYVGNMDLILTALGYEGEEKRKLLQTDDIVPVLDKLGVIEKVNISFTGGIPEYEKEIKPKIMGLHRFQVVDTSEWSMKMINDRHYNRFLMYSEDIKKINSCISRV